MPISTRVFVFVICLSLIGASGFLNITVSYAEENGQQNTGDPNACSDKFIGIPYETARMQYPIDKEGHPALHDGMQDYLSYLKNVKEDPAAEQCVRIRCGAGGDEKNCTNVACKADGDKAACKTRCDHYDDKEACDLAGETAQGSDDQTLCHENNDPSACARLAEKKLAEEAGGSGDDDISGGDGDIDQGGDGTRDDQLNDPLNPALNDGNITEESNPKFEGQPSEGGAAQAFMDQSRTQMKAGQEPKINYAGDQTNAADAANTYTNNNPDDTTNNTGDTKTGSINKNGGTTARPGDGKQPAARTDNVANRAADAARRFLGAGANGGQPNTPGQTAGGLGEMLGSLLGGMGGGGQGGGSGSGSNGYNQNTGSCNQNTSNQSGGFLGNFLGGLTNPFNNNSNQNCQNQNNNGNNTNNNGNNNNNNKDKDQKTEKQKANEALQKLLKRQKEQTDAYTKNNANGEDPDGSKLINLITQHTRQLREFARRYPAANQRQINRLISKNEDRLERLRKLKREINSANDDDDTVTEEELQEQLENLQDTIDELQNQLDGTSTSDADNAVLNEDASSDLTVTALRANKILTNEYRFHGSLSRTLTNIGDLVEFVDIGSFFGSTIAHQLLIDLQCDGTIDATKEFQTPYYSILPRQDGADVLLSEYLEITVAGAHCFAFEVDVYDELEETNESNNRSAWREFSTTATAQNTSGDPLPPLNFEVSVYSSDYNNMTQNWTSDDITISAGQQIAFRWDAPEYQQCVPLLSSLTPNILANVSPSERNTLTEDIELHEHTGYYELRCSVDGDTRIETIHITVEDSYVTTDDQTERDENNGGTTEQNFDTGSDGQNFSGDNSAWSQNTGN